MIKAIAVDDEPLALSVIELFCENVDFIELAASFTSTAEAMEYIRDNETDLLFLDIQMPAISGIDFYKTLPKDIMVIFTTAFSEYAVEGFNLNALDYLLKPFSSDRFLQAANKAKQYYEHNREAAPKTDCLYIKVDYNIVKVELTNMLYLEGVDNYIKIHLDAGKPVLTRMSMKDMAEKLSGSGFMRVHRSYIIPVNRVTSVRNKTLHMNKIEIPVGINYVKEIQRIFSSSL